MNAQSLLLNFELIAKSPGGVKRIRELVSYLAITGCLSEYRQGDSSSLHIKEHSFDAKERYIIKNKIRSFKRKHAELPQAEIKIPERWELLPVGDLVYLINGRAFKSTEWQTTGLPIIRIQNLNNPLASFNYFQGDVSERHRIANGDMLLSWSGTPGTSFGAFIWNGGDAVLNQHIFKVHIFSSLLDKEYLEMAVNSCLGPLIAGARGGVGLKHVTKGQIEALQIPLPPIEEQKRIVAKVDELITLCDKLEVQHQEREKVFPVLSRAIHERFSGSPVWENINFIFEEIGKVSPYDLRKSILTLAVQGKLVPQNPNDEPAEEIIKRIRADQSDSKWKQEELPFEIPSSWSALRLGSILEPNRGISYGIIKLGPEPLKGGVNVLRCSNVRFRRIDLTGIRKVTEELSSDYGRTVLRGGELLINVRGTLGGCAVVPSSLKGYNVAREVAVVPVHPQMNPMFLLNVVSAPYFQDRIDKSLRGIAYKGLNLGLLRNFLIPIPPLSEQHLIVSKVDQLMTLVDKLEEQQNKKSLVAEAFAQAAVATITGIQSREQERMKAPKTELVTKLQVQNKPKDIDKAPLTKIITKHKGELSAKSLWQQSGLEIDTFYQQLKMEMAYGWIIELEKAVMNEVENI